MKNLMIKNFMQAATVIIAGVFILGCPIDEEDIFNGDVDVVNNSGAALEFVGIHEPTDVTRVNLGALADGGTAPYSGYDCATSYVNIVRALVADADTISAPFIPSCGGTTTVTWDNMLNDVIS